MSPHRGQPLSLRAQALAMLARREHSRSELRRKLLAHLRKRQAPEAQSTRDQLGGVPDSEQDHGPDSHPSGQPKPGAEATDLATDAAAAEVDALLDWLSEKNYLSDSRFIECRVHKRSARLGVNRIRQELAQHGLQLDAPSLAQLRQSEFQRAFQVWERRFDCLAEDPKERARQARFLISRGFAADVVRRVLGGEMPEDSTL